MSMAISSLFLDCDYPSHVYLDQWCEEMLLGLLLTGHLGVGSPPVKQWAMSCIPHDLHELFASWPLCSYKHLYAGCIMRLSAFLLEVRLYTFELYAHTQT